MVRKWKYLHTKPFRIRGLIAAHYLKECPYIIEIGSFHMPITDFLTHRFKQAICIDPLMKPKKEKKILHIQEDYRFFNFKPFLKSPFALVLLGMDLPFDFKLFHLAASAKCVVIEFPPQHTPSKIQFEILKKRCRLQQIVSIGIDFSENEFGVVNKKKHPFLKRWLYVLSNASFGSPLYENR